MQTLLFILKVAATDARKKKSYERTAFCIQSSSFIKRRIPISGNSLERAASHILKT